MFLTLYLPACDNMSDQPKVRPLAASPFFADSASARPTVEGTVPRGHLDAAAPFYVGKDNGQDITQIPVPLTPQLLARGRERFNIYCQECHGQLGNGQGMIVLRGFPAPPSFHEERLRDAPVGHYFDVITHGYGKMMSYASQVDPGDRWAIIAYLRALQLSQHARIDQAPAAERAQLESEGQR